MKLFTLCVLISLSTIIKAQSTNGLVASYSFNGGNANDDIGTLHGNVNGAFLTSDRFGNPNSAYKFFDGESITIPHSPLLKQHEMTVSLWVKIDSFNAAPNSQNFIFTIGNSNSNPYFGSFCMSALFNGNPFSSVNGSYFSVSQNNPWESTQGSSMFANTGQWQHYVLAITDDSLKMYVDGVIQGSYYKGFRTSYTTDSIYIGVSGNSSYYGNLNGCVDDINIYSGEMTPQDIYIMYRAGNPVGLEETSNNDRGPFMYPNPSTGFVQLSKAQDIKVSDLTGKVLFVKSNTTNFDLSGYPSGIYLVSILGTAGQVQETYKISKL